MRALARAADQRMRGQALPAVLLAAQAGLLAWLAPMLLRDDTWLTLVAGRDVWRHGLPAHDELAVWTAGTGWIDQQWLAQLVFNAAESVAGLGGVFALHACALTVALAVAMGIARRRGASAGSVALICFLALLVAPWSWQPRAQSLAEVLFVALLALLLTDREGEPRRRTLLAAPLLVLWANVHGSVLLGALLVVVFAAIRLARRRTRPGRCALLLLTPLCLLVTPYGFETVDYYAGVIGNRHIAALAAEWRAPHGGAAIPFAVLAAVTVAVTVIASRRRRLNAFDAAVLAITLGASLTAVRHVVWFALAAITVVPPLLRDGRPTTQRVAGRFVAWSCAGLLALTFGVLLTRPDDWYEQKWPHEAGRSLVLAAGRNARSTIFVHGREADWLLWRYPSLRGRIAYDARLELLSADQIRAIVRFDRHREPGWTAATLGYDFVWINSRLRPELARTFARRNGTRVIYRDTEVTLVSQSRGVIARKAS